MARRIGEFELIARYFAPLAKDFKGAGGLKSDNAFLAADVSDGLLADAGHIGEASGVAVHIERERVPLSSAARRIVDAEPRHWANVLGGGDDYELVIAVPPRKVAALHAAARASGVKVTQIGFFGRGEGVRLTVDGRETRTPRKGYVHF